MPNGYIYILTNTHNSVLYTGVTSNLIKRINQHKSKVYKKSFTSKYNCHRLVYYEKYNSIVLAIEREKQIKNYSRNKKNKLVNSLNPGWDDLYKYLIH
ncbi:MAG: GIY-YIG nuclease family protein [Flavobacteriaceae bacterium]|nr:GIY-YIG nuclease family protein [Flavobacteriaceae bacterium]